MNKRTVVWLGAILNSGMFLECDTHKLSSKEETTAEDEGYYVALHLQEIQESIIKNGRYVPPEPTRSELHCIGGNYYRGTNSYCQFEGKELSPTEKIIAEHCYQDSSCVGYPKYSVTDSRAIIPILATTNIYDCTGIVIYHPDSTKGLMAHLLDGGVSDKVPNEEYIKFFKQYYFSDIPEDELQIHVEYGKNTSQNSIDLFATAVNTYFPKATVSFSSVTKACHRGDLFLDTRTGYYEASSREINVTGVGGMKGFCFPGLNNSEIN
jgi:hypothetical protein